MRPIATPKSVEAGWNLVSILQAKFPGTKFSLYLPEPGVVQVQTAIGSPLPRAVLAKVYEEVELLREAYKLRRTEVK